MSQAALPMQKTSTQRGREILTRLSVLEAKRERNTKVQATPLVSSICRPVRMVVLLEVTGAFSD